MEFDYDDTATLPLTHRTVTSTQIKAKKTAKVLARSCLLAGVMVAAVSKASAVTLFEYGVERDDATITEGYVGDIEQLRTQPADPLGTPLSQQLTQQLRVQLNREQLASGNNSSADPGHTDLQDLSGFHQHYNNSVWIVSVGSSVYSDADRDGFFSDFSIRFDADTEYLDARVYVRILLREGDQDYQLFHTSQTFDLYNYSLGDTYRVDGSLVSNYPANYYDVQVDLFDAYDGSLLDTVNASTHRTLSALPLESKDNVGVYSGNSHGPDTLADSTSPTSPDNDGASGARNQIVKEHVGSSFLVLPLALMFLAVRRLRRSQRMN